jgi:hypothetical protein
VRRPFEHYMADRSSRKNMVWTATRVRPDYLSSSRKRLVPQMIYKGGILEAWGKKQAVALHESFYSTLPDLPLVESDQADIAWLIYGLEMNVALNRYKLTHRQTVYTQFSPALTHITTPIPGSMDQFISVLQEKLDEKMDKEYSPDAPTLTDILRE